MLLILVFSSEYINCAVNKMKIGIVVRNASSMILEFVVVEIILARQMDSRKASMLLFYLAWNFWHTFCKDSSKVQRFPVCIFICSSSPNGTGKEMQHRFMWPRQKANPFLCYNDFADMMLVENKSEYDIIFSTNRAIVC